MNEIHMACGTHCEESVRSSVFAFFSMRGTIPEIASKPSRLIKRSYRWY